MEDCHYAKCPNSKFQHTNFTAKDSIQFQWLKAVIYIYFHLDKDKQCLLNITFRLISGFFVLFLSLLIKSCSFPLKLYVTDWLTDWMRRWEFFISALSCWRRRWSDLDAAKQNPNKLFQWEEETKTAQASILMGIALSISLAGMKWVGCFINQSPISLWSRYIRIADQRST